MERLRMQQKVSSVIAEIPLIAGNGSHPLHTVALQASLRKHQAQMRRLAAHPQRHHIAAGPSAPEMGMAAAGHADARLRIIIRQHQADPRPASHRVNIKIRIVDEAVRLPQPSPTGKSARHPHIQLLAVRHRSPDSLIAFCPVHPIPVAGMPQSENSSLGIVLQLKLMGSSLRNLILFAHRILSSLSSRDVYAYILTLDYFASCARERHSPLV